MRLRGAFCILIGILFACLLLLVYGLGAWVLLATLVKAYPPIDDDVLFPQSPPGLWLIVAVIGGSMIWNVGFCVGADLADRLMERETADSANRGSMDQG
jgi:ABC-type thiamin/hydroxymethylpyrimidine transport system permease subunit